MKRKAGRPKADKTRATINVSIDAELKEKARQMATASNRSISNWLETVIAKMWQEFNSK